MRWNGWCTTVYNSTRGLREEYAVILNKEYPAHSDDILTGQEIKTVWFTLMFCSNCSLIMKKVQAMLSLSIISQLANFFYGCIDFTQILLFSPTSHTLFTFIYSCPRAHTHTHTHIYIYIYIYIYINN